MRTVLVVEDDPNAAELMELALLQTPDVAVQLVNNAADARNALSCPWSHFDAVITDIHLPGEDGLSLTEGIRNVPVIVVTSSPDPALRERAAAAGARAFLEKPWSASHLRDTVNSVLDAV
ncbi:MAG TPA: response regulator [Bryobacteraceae bacterium]|nr:response regulator [Bryobacteraceae bacterium]